MRKRCGAWMWKVESGTWNHLVTQTLSRESADG